MFNSTSFVYDIKSGSISIVIGNDLSILRLKIYSISNLPYYNDLVEAGKVDGEYLYINLYKYLAIKMWFTHGEGALQAEATINNVVLRLRNLKKSDSVCENFIKIQIKKLTDDQIVLEPFRKLAKIQSFETFITVNIDNFLERAFKAENIHVNRSLNFSLPIPAMKPDQRQDKAIASIFNLMGNIEDNDFAITDERCLEYLFEIQKANDAFSIELFNTINQKDILFTGSSFPDWFMRFFIRIISREPYKTSKKAKYVACDRTVKDKELFTFLENNSTQVIPIDTTQQTLNENNVYKTSTEFIDEIYIQYIGTGQDERNKILYKELFFISYSRDDKLLAVRLRNEFQRNGLNIFYDEDSLQTGDQYNKKIKNAIRDCTFFVALISENAIRDKNRYVYDKEWKYAIFQNGEKDSSSSYIRPFIIDNTAATDARIPEEMRQLNIKTIPDFNNLGEIVQKFIQENKLTPLI